MERLDKIIANTGHWSRKEVRDLVKQGRVVVNGVRPKSFDEKYDRVGLELLVDGEVFSVEKFTYIMMHKPAGCLSATEDSRQETVIDLLPEHLRKVDLFPVGRLDKDTEGLLLLTNDGQLGHRLLAPKKHVDKIYYTEVDGVLNGRDIEVFRSGLVLDDGLECMPADLEILPDGKSGLVTLREGKYHQVKRMLEQQGKPVTYLKRMSMGPLKLDEMLEKGQWRHLNPQERHDLGV